MNKKRGSVTLVIVIDILNAVGNTYYQHIFTIFAVRFLALKPLRKD